MYGVLPPQLTLSLFSFVLALSLHDPLAEPLFAFSLIFLPSMPLVTTCKCLHSFPLINNLYEFPRSEPSDYVLFVYRTLYSSPFLLLISLSQHLFFTHHHRFLHLSTIPDLCILPITASIATRPPLVPVSPGTDPLPLIPSYDETWVYPTVII
jgi:hypothetical protein